MRPPERRLRPADRRLRGAIALLLAGPAPFVLVLTLLRPGPAGPSAPAWLGVLLLTSCWATGCLGVALAPVSVRLRWIVGVAWGALLAPALLVFALAADCGLYGLCL